MINIGSFSGVKKQMPVSRNVSTCEKCGEGQFPTGAYFVLQDIVIPVRFRFLFFNITFDASPVIRYCPKCGFLKVELMK